MAAIDAELVLDARAALGEGPVWDAATGALLWVDINRSLLHRFSPETRTDVRHDLGQPVGAVAPRRAGGLAVALRDGIGLLDSDTSRAEVAIPIEPEDPGSRLNDGKCDPQGRFWVGTTRSDGRTGAGALYRVDADQGLTRVLDGVTISNGLDWSPDGSTMYYIDTPTGRVDAFDWDGGSGSIGNRRVLVEIPPSSGMPDGMTVDAEGFLWVALWNGWAVHRYSPDGELDRVVKLPVAQVTSCAFGGPDLGDLYITSGSFALGRIDRLRQRRAGGLFRIRPGVAGRPASLFAG